MVESDLCREKIGVVNEIQSQNQEFGFQRDPSFSGWCDENGKIHPSHHSENADACVEDFDFALPSCQWIGSENKFIHGEKHQYSKLEQTSMQMNGGNNMEGISTPRSRNTNEKYLSFDIENESRRELSSSNIGENGHNTTANCEASAMNSKSYLSAADVLKTLFFILAWYTFSTFLTLYNKTLLGDDLGNFPAPLLMNTVHFLMQAVLSRAIMWLWSQRFQHTVNMSWRDYFTRVVPTALATAMDINLSNASLVFISVTFATMCKSASPIFLLLFAFAFRLESPSIKLLGIILIISIGILLTVAKETEFEFWGFIFVMLAAVMSGFRWAMTQILLQKEVYGLKNPLTLMSYVTPVMAAATGILSLVMDPWHEFNKSNYFNNSWHIMRSCLLMFVGGTLAFFMVLTEYILVSVTSAVTVTIAGVVKEAVTILVAVFYFHDKFTWLKGVGLFTIMVGVSLFNWYKYQKIQKGASSEDDVAGSLRTSATAKYVIIDDWNYQDDGP